MKKIFWFVLGGIFFTAIALIFIYALFIRSLGVNFVHESNVETLSNRIYFQTKPVEDHSQGNRLFSRVHLFFIDHPEYNIPEDVYIKPINAGASQMDQLVYFRQDPVEIYRITFDYSGSNYVSEVYFLDEGEFILRQSESIDDNEKRRILNRLHTEILNKINWTF